MVIYCKAVYVLCEHCYFLYSTKFAFVSKPRSLQAEGSQRVATAVHMHVCASVNACHDSASVYACHGSAMDCLRIWPQSLPERKPAAAVYEVAGKTSQQDAHHPHAYGQRRYTAYFGDGVYINANWCCILSL